MWNVAGGRGRYASGGRSARRFVPIGPSRYIGTRYSTQYARGGFNGNASTIENGPMQIILDVMVDNTWQRAWNVGLLDSTLTRQLDIDYIRVFQQRLRRRSAMPQQHP